MTFDEKRALEVRRLRDLNPDIRACTPEWQKLYAVARVNVCRRDGIYHPLFEYILQLKDPSIVINGIEPPISGQRTDSQLTLF